jgi:hypothetical protein
VKAIAKAGPQDEPYSLKSNFISTSAIEALDLSQGLCHDIYVSGCL